MDTILGRIKQKAQQAIQGVGNFIDRDKTMQGVQLAPGGLGNRITSNLNPTQYVGNFRDSAPDVLRRVSAIPRNIYQAPVPQPLQRPAQMVIDSADWLRDSPIATPARWITGDFGRADENMAQSMVTRPAASTVLSISDLLGGPDTLDVPQDDPIAQGLFGAKPLRSHQKMAATTGKDFLVDDLGVNEQDADSLVPAMAIAGFALDLTPPGFKSGAKEGGRTALKNSKKALKVVDQAQEAVNFRKLLDASRRTLTSNVTTIGELLSNRNAQNISENLDFLPKYADELAGEVADLTSKIRNYDLVSQVDTTLPAKTDLQSILKQKRAELRAVNKQIEQIIKQKPLKNQATMIVDEAGNIIPLKQPVNSTQQLDDVLTQAQEVAEANRNALRQSDEVLQLPAPKETLSLPLGERSVTIKQLRKLVDQGGSLDGVKVNAQNAKEAREAIRLGVNADNIVPAWVKGAGRTTETLFDANGNILKNLPENQQVFDFAKEASEESLNTGNKFTRGLRNMFLDTEDNLRRTFKDSYKQFEPIMESFKTRIADGYKWMKSYQDQAVDVVRNYNIKVGGEEDKLIRLFQQKNGVEKVVRKVGAKRAGELEQAYQFLRDKYDEIFDFVNAKREAAGLELLPYQGDTFLSQQGGKSGSMFDSLLEGLPKEADTASSTIFKKQSADASTGAFESFTKYLESAQRAGFTDLSGQEIRNAANTLAEMGGDKEAVDQLYKFSQNILGDKQINPVLKTIENVTGKMAGAKVLGKASTLVSQTLSLPQAIGRDPIAFFRGNLTSKALKNLRSQSKVLDVVSQSVPKELRAGNAYTKSIGFAGDVLIKGQDVANRLIYNGFLSRAKKMGLPDAEAVKWADEQLVKIVGDRRLGMSPQAYSNFIGKIFGRFTLEPTAATTRLVKDVGEKKFGAVLGTLVAWHIGNKINEKYGTGYAPFPDPWQAIVDSGEFATGSDTTEQNKLKAVTRLVSESLQTMPMINNVFNTAYSVGETAGILPDSRDVMGDDQTWMNVGSLYNPLAKWDRNITGNKAVDVPWNIASNTLPFFEQGARTTQAANTLNRGYAVTKDGAPMYEAPQGVDAVRSLLFGQSSTQNARDFFDNDFVGWLSDKQKATLDKLPNKEAKLNFIRSAQESRENVNRLNNKSINNILSGDSGINPTTKAEKEALKDYVTTSLEGGVIPSDTDIKNGLFNGYTATSKSIEERMDVYKSLNSALNDEYLSEEQKQAIIKASGADPRLASYYNLASKDQEVRLQEIVPQLDNLSDEDKLSYLMSGRRAVGGKQLVSSAMVDYLYEMDYLSDSERKAIKALKYDEINDKFYYSKSYKGSGGARMSFSQAEKLYNTSLPKFSKLKSLDFLLSLDTGAQTKRTTDTLLSSILNAPIRRNTNNNLWF